MVRRLFLLVALLALVMGAGYVLVRPHVRITHADREGPLSVSSGHGGQISSARKPPWYAAHGSYVLCRQDPDADIEIEAVRYHTSVRPRAVRTLLRHVSEHDLRHAEPGRVIPVGSDSGHRPDLVDRHFAGTTTLAVAGAKVDLTCDQSLELRRVTARHWVPAHPYTELFFVMEVGRRGGVIDRGWVDYRADGKPYTVEIDWTMGACGTAVRRFEGTAVCRSTRRS